MSRSVICHACGKRLEVCDAYRRNKVQCGCGVYCELPVPTEGAEAFPAPPRRDPPAAPAAPEPPARPRRAGTPLPPPRREGKGLVTCPNCGELVRPLRVKRGQ